MHLPPHAQTLAAETVIVTSFDVDEIYWKFLYEKGRDKAMLDDVVLARKGEFLKRNKDQFETY